MSPVSISALWVLAASYSAAAIAIAAKREFRDWRALVLIGICAVLLRSGVMGGAFHGLEYEDAFVYSVSGRLIALGQPTNLSGLTDVCAVGSLVACETWETYSGHLLGVPVLIADVARLTGYHPLLANYLSAGSSAVLVVGVFLAARRISKTREVALIAAALAAVTPIFSTFGGGSSAEPVSSALIALAIWLYLESVYLEGSWRVLLFTAAALLVVFTLAICVKRENLLLMAALPLATFAQRGEPRAKYRAALLLTGLGIATALAMQRLPSLGSLAAETGEYGGYPFSWRLLVGIAPTFARVLFNPTWAIGLGPLVLVATAVAVHRRDRALHAAFVAAGFFLLYSSHVRSYYQLNFGDLSPFDALRYLTNVVAPIAILGAIGASTIWGKWPPSPVRRIVAIGICGVYLLLGVYYSIALRVEWGGEEARNRVEPAVAAAAVAGTTGYVITPEPLLIQIYGDSRTRVADLYTITPDQLELLRRADLPVFFLDTPALKESHVERRIGPVLSTLRRTDKTTVRDTEAYQLYKLK